MDENRIDYSKLSPEFRKKLEDLEKTKPEYKQLQAITDIADMVQELLNVADKSRTDKTLEELGAILTDSREQLVALNKKETPETPDYASPIVEAVNRVEKALADEISKIDLTPKINLPAPQVNVEAPNVNVPEVKVDLSNIDKAIKAVPAAFEKAIKSIPQPELPDNQPVVDLLETMREHLEQIEEQSRRKPLPGSIKVTNMDGTIVGPETIFHTYDYAGFTNDDGNGNYQTISLKSGGVGGTTLYTLALTYDTNNNVTSVART